MNAANQGPIDIPPARGQREALNAVVGRCDPSCSLWAVAEYSGLSVSEVKRTRRILQTQHTGAIYFVPQNRLAMWQHIVDSLKKGAR